MPITLTTSVKSAYGMKALHFHSMYESAANIQLAPRCWAVMFKMLAVSNASRTLMSNLSSGGFSLLLSSSETIQAQIVDGAAATQTKAHSTTLTVDGKIHIAVGQYQGHGGSGALQVSMDGGTLQDSASLTGYTAAPTAPLRFGLNAAASTGDADDIEFFGFAWADTVQTSEQLATHWTNCIAARRMAPFVAGTTVRFNTDCSMRNLNPRISWVSDDESVTLSLSASTGSTQRPIMTRHQSPTWGP